RVRRRHSAASAIAVSRAPTPSRARSRWSPEVLYRNRGRSTRSVRLALIALARAKPPLAEEDGDEHHGDAQELAEASAIDGRPDHRDKKQQRQHSRRGRHEDHASSHADGGASDWGSAGAGEAGPVRRIRRNAHAMGAY